MTNNVASLKRKLKRRKKDLREYQKEIADLQAKSDQISEQLDQSYSKAPDGQYGSEEYTTWERSHDRVYASFDRNSKVLLLMLEGVGSIESDIDALEAQLSEAKENDELRLAEITTKEAQAQREHEEKMAKIELLKLEQQRLAAEAARDAAALAKAQESEQFAAILKGLKDDEI